MSGEKEEVLIKQTLVKCKRCASPDCTYTEHGDTFEYSCVSCGFITNSDMKEGTEDCEDFLEMLPALYKEVAYLDGEGYYWTPKALNDDERGMLFLDGTSKSDVEWSVVRMVDVEEDSALFEKGVKKKPDYSNKKEFGENYLEALLYWGGANE